MATAEPKKDYRRNEMSFRPDDKLFRTIKDRAHRAGVTVPEFIIAKLREALNGKVPRW